MSIPTRPAWPALALGLVLVAGCDQPTGSTRPKSTIPPPAEVAEQPAPPPAEAPRVPIVGKTTQEVRDPNADKQPGGVVTPPRITAKDPITLQGNAYVFAIGKLAIDQIKHAVDLYQAETGEYPKTLDEFMEKIIKANNIRLPQLPVYQAYGYDVPSHSLVVIEYPDKK